MKVLSVVGYKKSGKTTLVERLVCDLKNQGSVGTIKHIHEHRLNDENTDTWKHVHAGAEVVIGITPFERVKFSKNNDLTDALDELADAGMDFCIVEGFKDSRLPKIALGEIEATDILYRLDNTEKTDISEIIHSIMNQPDHYTLNSLIKNIKKSNDIDKAGAIGTFTGIVRKITDDTCTEYLEFEEYGKVARKRMNEISLELKEKEGIIDVLMHHKTGIIPSGKDIVYIVVAASHRQQLFPVLQEAIERLKAEVPIWKKEHSLKGEWWVHDDIDQQ